MYYNGGKWFVLFFLCSYYICQVLIQVFILKHLLHFLFMCLFVWGMLYMPVHMDFHGIQERTLNQMELELQGILSHLTRVLGIKFGSSGRVAKALNC